MKKIVACLIVLIVAACVALGVIASKNADLNKQLTASQENVQSIAADASAKATELEAVKADAAKAAETAAAELETAKHEFVRNCMDYDYADFPDMDGKRCTEIWTKNGNYIRWTEL